LNKLEVRETTTDYGYEYLGIFIDNILLDKFLFKSTHNEMISALMPAWYAELDNKGEQEYIDECLSIEDEQGVTIPILLCPEDMDFWCIVIVAKIRYTDEHVIWDKVGIVKKDNWDTTCWVNSGIRNFEKWTDEEWEQYGSYFDLFNLKDWRWDSWITENSREEEKRRVLNYTHGYLNKDENIEWFGNMLKLIFDKEEYKKSIRGKKSLD
jgi:hypothetical protein